MKHKRIKREIRRIAFIINRSSLPVREFFLGVMMYTRHNPTWFVHIFETGYWKHEKYLDFGGYRPDGIVACDVPAGYVRRYLARRGMGDVPIIAFPQVPCENLGCVSYDTEQIAKRAINLFKSRGCRHVAFVGTHMPWKIRASRSVAKAFAAEAEREGLEYSIPLRKVYNSSGVQMREMTTFCDWIRSLPKPCGILVYEDGIGRDLLDFCRTEKVPVIGQVYMLGMDNNSFICETSNPTLSSIQFDYEQAAFRAARALDEMIEGRMKEPPHFLCHVKDLRERASTQSLRGASERIVALASEYIEQNANRPGGLTQEEIAKHLGVSVRTLQIKFRSSTYVSTLLHEIRVKQLERVRQQLSTTNKSIKDITYDCGFKSLSRLKVIFLEHYKMTMREYRKLAKSTPPPSKS